MRSLLIAGLILFAAPRLQAQDSLPLFVFNGHHIGEARPTTAPRDQCTVPEAAQRQMLCIRERLDGVSFDAGYTYSSKGSLAGVSALVDSAEFKPLVAALTRRYGQPRALRSGTGHDYAQWRFRDGKLHLTRTGTLVVLRFAAAG